MGRCIAVGSYQDVQLFKVYEWLAGTDTCFHVSCPAVATVLTCGIIHWFYFLRDKIKMAVSVQKATTHIRVPCRHAGSQPFQEEQATDGKIQDIPV